MNVVKHVKKLFKRYNPGSILAYKKGRYTGKMIALICINKSDKAFLLLPDMLPYNIANSDFNYLLATDELEYIEELPSHVFDVIKAQYLKNIHAV